MTACYFTRRDALQRPAITVRHLCGVLAPCPRRARAQPLQRGFSRAAAQRKSRITAAFAED